MLSNYPVLQFRGMAQTIIPVQISATSVRIFARPFTFTRSGVVNPRPGPLALALARFLSPPR